MASTKEKPVSAGSSGSGGAPKKKGSLVPPELFQVGSYKRSQGRTVRLVTAIILAVIVGLAGWRLRETLLTASAQVQWLVPGAVLLIGWWLCYRLINLPKFADFLIAVEAEMTKVSWPTQTELFRSSLVVILFIVSLAALLFVFDLFWQWLFKLIGII